MNTSQLLICSKEKKKLECISKYWNKKVTKYAERSNDAPAMDLQNLQEKEIRLVFYTYIC